MVYFFSVYTSGCHNLRVLCHCLWILLSEREKIWHGVNSGFNKAKLIKTIFAGNVNMYKWIKNNAFEAWSHWGSLTSTQTSLATEFQRDSLQVQTCKQPFFFSLLLLGGKSYTHHWKLQSRQRQFVTYLCITRDQNEMAYKEVQGCW